MDASIYLDTIGKASHGLKSAYSKKMKDPGVDEAFAKCDAGIREALRLERRQWLAWQFVDLIGMPFIPPMMAVAGPCAFFYLWYENGFQLWTVGLFAVLPMFPLTSMVYQRLCREHQALMSMADPLKPFAHLISRLSRFGPFGQLVLSTQSESRLKEVTDQHLRMLADAILELESSGASPDDCHETRNRFHYAYGLLDEAGLVGKKRRDYFPKNASAS